MNPKILVTGATGTIGSFVVDQLKEKEIDFKALVRSEEKGRKLAEKGINTVVGDFADPASLEKALEGIEKVFLLSVTSPEAPKLQGSLVDAAKKAGVSHIVKISSMGASKDSPIGIARFHAEIEDHIKRSGISYTFLQPHSFLQNLIFDSGTIRQEASIYAPMGDGRIAMVDARDIAAVAVEALTGSGHEDKTYVLTGPEAHSYHELASVFTDVLGKEIKYVPVTSVDSRSSMLEAGMPGWLVDDLVNLNLAFSEGAGDVISPDVEEVTGRKGRTLKAYVEDYAHLFR